MGLVQNQTQAADKIHAYRGGIYAGDRDLAMVQLTHRSTSIPEPSYQLLDTADLSQLEKDLEGMELRAMTYPGVNDRFYSILRSVLSDIVWKHHPYPKTADAMDNMVLRYMRIR